MKKLALIFALAVQLIIPGRFIFAEDSSVQNTSTDLGDIPAKPAGNSATDSGDFSAKSAATDSNGTAAKPAKKKKKKKSKKSHHKKKRSKKHAAKPKAAQTDQLSAPVEPAVKY